MLLLFFRLFASVLAGTCLFVITAVVFDNIGLKTSLRESAGLQTTKAQREEESPIGTEEYRADSGKEQNGTLRRYTNVPVSDETNHRNSTFLKPSDGMHEAQLFRAHDCLVLNISLVAHGFAQMEKGYRIPSI